MKKVHILILKAFIRPFIVTFFIVMFVLLMLFLFKYIDDLIGKGFEWYVILELMMYASATNVAMALPLSVLLSSIMTYGSLGENYELVAIKAAGISLRRAMYPMFVLITLLAISAFVFSDYMLPVANLKYYSLLYDARQAKAAFLIQDGIFNNSIENYSIKVQKKEADGKTLKNVVIYQKDPMTAMNNIVFAKEGTMFRTQNDKFLVLRLKDGVRYEERQAERTYNPRQQFIRFRFKETEQKFDLSSFGIKRTPENEFKDATQMLNLKQLQHFEDSVGMRAKKTEARYAISTMSYMRYFQCAKKPDRKITTLTGNDVLKTIRPSDHMNALSNAVNEARSIKDFLSPKALEYKDTHKMLRRYGIEYEKKFTFSVACLVLFLIGAPLGAIIRKGGLGLPVVISVIFFLIYHIISTIGEKAAKEGDWPVPVGMWIAIAVLTPLGLFLSYKAATDSVIFDIEIYKQFFQKFFQRFFTRKKTLPEQV
ncbi:MAG: LptF/LptG family permease [Mucilaginibacter polytrichastri]|nr:LptF/LptG family permease [Mucilaginibacter polytrichastri]